jgi:hypothetical protein
LAVTKPNYQKCRPVKNWTEGIISAKHYIPYTCIRQDTGRPCDRPLSRSCCSTQQSPGQFWNSPSCLKYHNRHIKRSFLLAIHDHLPVLLDVKSS